MARRREKMAHTLPRQSRIHDVTYEAHLLQQALSKRKSNSDIRKEEKRQKEMMTYNS